MHEVGPEWFLETLLNAGANKQTATQAWVDNHYSWVIWKLAAYEQSHSAQLKGKLLTAEVVLDQLKYRYAWILQLFLSHVCKQNLSSHSLCTKTTSVSREQSPLIAVNTLPVCSLEQHTCQTLCP